MQQKLFGERLRKIRKEKGLTQEEFAKLLGISPGYVWEMESGLKAPSETILLLMEYRLAINTGFLKTAVGSTMRDAGDAESVAGDDQKIVDILRIIKADASAREVIYEILEQDKSSSRVANTVKRFLQRRMEFGPRHEGPDGNTDTGGI